MGIRHDRPVTNLVLNKLAYFAHGFHYRINKDPLILNDYPPFEAWQYGPVSPDIYHEYKYYGGDVISDSTRSKINIDENTVEYLVNFWNHFAINYTPSQLVSMAHADGGAWHKAWNSGLNYIPERYIREEFTNETR